MSRRLEVSTRKRRGIHCSHSNRSCLVAPEMMKKVVQAALLYPDWMEKNGKTVSAADALDPDKDSDVYEEYGEDHRY